MAQSAERSYEFLSRDEALDDAPLHSLDLAPEQRRTLIEAHRRIARLLTVITVERLDYAGRLKADQMVVHDDLVDNIQERFAFLRDIGFAIEKMIPQVKYGHNDDSAMADNNTSCQRTGFTGDPTRGILSKHLVGAAVDIEPVHNKLRKRNGLVMPPYTKDYEERPKSMLMYNLPARLNFSDEGWEYGGTWPVAGIEMITGHRDHYPGAPADEHHFELRDEKLPKEAHLIDMHTLTLPAGIIFHHPAGEPGRLLAAFAAA